MLENPCKHPTIILPGDIIFTDLKTIIDFVYRGEIDVTESELQVSDESMTDKIKTLLGYPFENDIGNGEKHS